MRRSNSLPVLLLTAFAAGMACGDDVRSSIALRLVPGDNFFSIPLQPDRATLGEVLPAGSLPAGRSDDDSTVLFTYAGSSDAQPGPVHYRLDEQGHWVSSAGGIADDTPLPVGEGFNLRLPAGAAPASLAVSGRAPPGPVVRELAGRDGAIHYHVAGWPFPCPVQVKDLGLREAGFGGGRNVAQSDELRILDNTGGQGAAQTPKARIWFNEHEGHFEFTAPRTGVADAYVVEPGEAIIVVRKRAPDLRWTMSSSCPPPVDAQ